MDCLSDDLNRCEVWRGRGFIVLFSLVLLVTQTFSKLLSLLKNVRLKVQLNYFVLPSISMLKQQGKTPTLFRALCTFAESEKNIEEFM